MKSAENSINLRKAKQTIEIDKVMLSKVKTNKKQRTKDKSEQEGLYRFRTVNKNETSEEKTIR